MQLHRSTPSVPPPTQSSPADLSDEGRRALAAVYGLLGEIAARDASDDDRAAATNDTPNRSSTVSSDRR